MTKLQTQTLLSKAQEKNGKMWNCLFDLSMFRGRLTLDEFDNKNGLVTTKSQSGLGIIKISGLKFQGSLN